MAIKTILTEPSKKLRQVSLPVEKVGKEEQNLMNDMLETMYNAKGIGLAAIQIGVPKRVIVMDLAKAIEDQSAEENSQEKFDETERTNDSTVASDGACSAESSEPKGAENQSDCYGSSE